MNALAVDVSYRNTNNPNDPRDMFNRFFRILDKGINNTSGFRAKSKASGSTDIEACAFCVLVTNFGETEWPDELDRESGLFTYYGDNRRPGPIHDTPVGGNRLLRRVFADLHTGQRAAIPPFLVFEKYKTPGETHMRFLGLAAPGAQGMSAIDDLVAVWRVAGTTRFQNYKARFTILREETIPREWLAEMVNGTPPVGSAMSPKSWKRWVDTGVYAPLICARKREPRSRRAQQPQSAAEKALLDRIVADFTDREFEFAAAAIVQLMDNRFTGFHRDTAGP
jgi:Restriction endonuclease AspBHI N-terminal